MAGKEEERDTKVIFIKIFKKVITIND